MDDKRGGKKNLDETRFALGAIILQLPKIEP